MFMSTEVNDEGDELILRLRLRGVDTAVSSNQIMLYAQIEDPENQGIFESVSCAVELDFAIYFMTRENLEI